MNLELRGNQLTTQKWGLYEVCSVGLWLVDKLNEIQGISFWSHLAGLFFLFNQDEYSVL